MQKGFVIAIDGPVASGKGTIAAMLAKDLGGFYLYTGAMYRSIALLCIDKGIDLQDPQKVESVLSELEVRFENGKILLQGVDVTERIKKQDSASGASIVGVIPGVRLAVDKKLRTIAEGMVREGRIVVSEGRDTATTIFPEAPIKIYLTASDTVRAKRRMHQYSNLPEEDLMQALSALKERDARDTGRDTSPLPTDPKQAGYFVLDNSEIGEAETLEIIKKELRNRKLIA